MTTPIKILLGLLVIAALALGISLMDNGDGPGLTDPVDDPTQSAAPEKPDTPGEALTAKPDTKRKVLPEVVRQKTSITAAAGDTFDQGVQGLLVNEYDRPIEGARVYLMPALGFESLRMFNQHREGVRFPPIAETMTAANGVFKLGIEKWTEGKEYEVRITHADYCDHKLPRLVPQPEDWWDVGRVKLKAGVTLFGRVTTETGLPIPEATISAKDGSGMLNITPIPGREHGITTVTDSGGNYEIRNLDPTTMFSVSAIADDYAKSEKNELQLEAGTRQRVDFQLAPGLDIAGMVRGPNGNPVHNAKVTVSALSQKSRQVEEAQTDKEGYFVTSGLKAGIYAVMVEAQGFLTADEKPIQAGKKDLEINLEAQGNVLITVLGRNGGPLANFHCSIKGAFEGQTVFGNAIQSKSVKGAKDGTVEISGINPMTYVAEIQASGYAKNFSERFTIMEGGKDTPKVTVQLNSGGSIHGFVKDMNGEPIRGVTVTTRPNLLVDNPFLKIFPVPYTISRMTGKTSGVGEFRFNMLYPGKYQLMLMHKNYCTVVVNNVDVQLDQTTPLPDLRMTKGCVVTGIAKVDGVPHGQVKVTVSAIADERNPVPFSCDAISDNEGKFWLSKRLMPGKYEVMAAEQVQANPLLMLVQFSKSKKTFFVSKTTTSHQLDINIQKMDK